MSIIDQPPKILQGWKAWYGNGKTYTSKKKKWVDIPINNFQYLKKFYYRQTDSFSGLDLYCITNDHEEIEKLIKEDPRNIKIGQLIENWRKIESKAFEDKEIVTVMK